MHLLSHVKALIGFPLRFILALCRWVLNRRPPRTIGDEEAPTTPLSSSHTCGFRSSIRGQDKICSSSSSTIGQSYTRLGTTSPPPLVCKKKALLIGILYKSKNANSRHDGQLRGPHVDVLNMRRLLLDCYNYNPDDITVLIDDGDDGRAQPTEENIIQSMKDLVADAHSGDQFYFHFSGHGAQVDDDNEFEEEDGLDECIVTCDNKTIRDDVLNQLLIAPLPVGSTFVSTLDSCHSGTLLDLMHYHCNRIYVPWTNKGVRQTDFLRNIVARQETQLYDKPHTVQAPVIQVSMEPVETESPIVPFDERTSLLPNVTRLAPPPSLSITIQPLTSHWVDSSATPISYSMSPISIYCTGRCREEPGDVKLMADVISISAAQDYQLAWENSRGSTMTEALIKVLRRDPHSDLKHILTSISHELHSFYVELHDESREYKKMIKKCNIKRKLMGKQLWKGDTVEINNFQDPQISSHSPLDMTRPLPL